MPEEPEKAPKGRQMMDQSSYSFRLLAERIQARQVIPLIGSGLAAPFGYKPWRKLLLAEAGRCGPELQTLVNQRLDEAEYEVAADLLHGAADDSFLSALAQHYQPVTTDLAQAEHFYSGPARLLADPALPAAVLLPRLFSGPVLTTTFDPTLPRLYQAAGLPFVREVAAPDGGVVSQLAVHQRILLRLNGSPQAPETRVVLRDEYRRRYLEDKASEERARIDLLKDHPNLLIHLFSMRSVLFLGCSLAQDRILDVLQRVAEFLPDSHHFAVLPRPELEPKLRSLLRRLKRHNVHPLFYPAGRYDELTRLLQELVPLCTPAEHAPGSPLDASGREAEDDLGTFPSVTRSERPLLLCEPGSPPPCALSRGQLRQLLDRLLPDDADLMQFLLDYFPRVHRQVGRGMTRSEKYLLLLERAEEEAILSRLREDHPQAFGRGVQALLQSGRPPSARAEILLAAGGGSVDLLAELCARRADPEVRELVAHFRELLEPSDPYTQLIRLRLDLRPDQVALDSQPQLVDQASQARIPEGRVTLPRTARSSTPRIFIYRPRRYGDSYTLVLEPGPSVRLSLLAPGPVPTPTLAFIERAPA